MSVSGKSTVGLGGGVVAGASDWVLGSMLRVFNSSFVCEFVVCWPMRTLCQLLNFLVSCICDGDSI